MKEEDIRLIKQEIKSNREAGKCGLASNNEKFEWTKTADALERLLDYITNLQEEKDSIDDYARHLHNENKTLQEENERLKDIRNLAIDYNKTLCKLYDCGTELSNAETNLCILKDEETINILQGKSDE